MSSSDVNMTWSCSSASRSRFLSSSSLKLVQQDRASTCLFVLCPLFSLECGPLRLKLFPVLIVWHPTLSLPLLRPVTLTSLTEGIKDWVDLPCFLYYLWVLSNILFGLQNICGISPPMMAIKRATLYDNQFVYIIDVPSLCAGPHPILDCIAQAERQDNNGLYRTEQGRD